MYNVLSLCIIVVYYRRVLSLCIIVVYYRRVLSSCIIVVYYRRVLSSCIIVVYYRRVLFLCIIAVAVLSLYVTSSHSYDLLPRVITIKTNLIHYKSVVSHSRRATTTYLQIINVSSCALLLKQRRRGNNDVSARNYIICNAVILQHVTIKYQH